MNVETVNGSQPNIFKLNQVETAAINYYIDFFLQLTILQETYIKSKLAEIEFVGGKCTKKKQKISCDLQDRTLQN